MQALEMESEETQSFVGSGRKRVQHQDSSTTDFVARLVTNQGFIGKVLGVAFCALFVLLIASSGDSSSYKQPPDVELKNGGAPMQPPHSPSPTPAPTPAPVAAASSPGSSSGSSSTPGSGSSGSSSSSGGSIPSSSSSNNNDSGDGGIPKYSDYATIVPLPDHPLPDDETKQALEEKWGRWHFWDGDEDERPSEDYLPPGKYPNNDIPGDEFPDEAWQADAVFVNHILNDADKLITRAMEAIFTEYGHGKPLEPEELGERMKMFHWDKIDLSATDNPPPKYSKKGDRGNGGWTTKRSFDGLVRRLLHAIMTGDTFTVVMGGHSAAVGQGNHFRQSYMMQFHKVLSPIMARLGVKLVTRNMAQGGMGTVHFGMGSGSIYGDEVDLILWDSGMTENNLPHHIDLFLRQALIGGNRVPVVWGGNFELLQMLHEQADVDVGEWGEATDGIIEIESLDKVNEVPYAARYMKCSEAAQSACDSEPRFCSKCWIARSDGVTPTTSQLEKPRGQVKWHPGWRKHQLIGRNIAFGLLQALQAAVDIFSEGVMGGPPLDEDLWHVTDYYENIREKVKNLGAEHGQCHTIKDQLPERMCSVPMKARTQYTPRANFHETSLTSIIKPASNGYVPKNEIKALYDGPDAHNDCFDLPDDAIDVYNIVVGRRRLEEIEQPYDHDEINELTNFNIHNYINTTRSLQESIEPGKGWEVFGEPQGYCDGTYSQSCGIQADNECVLYGHHDARGAIIGNEFSGWLVMTLKDLKEGIIVIKLHTWHYASELTIANDWNSVNNERRRLGTAGKVYQEMMLEMDPSREYYEVDETGERMLMRSYDTPDLPDTFEFDFAIDGKITTLNREAFLEKKQQVQRVVETLTLLDDPSFTSEAKDVEVAIRMRGCKKDCTFGLSHVYWA